MDEMLAEDFTPSSQVIVAPPNPPSAVILSRTSLPRPTCTLNRSHSNLKCSKLFGESSRSVLVTQHMFYRHKETD